MIRLEWIWQNVFFIKFEFNFNNKKSILYPMNFAGIFYLSVESLWAD